jgi:phosphoserine phosphatase RsbU/P
VIALLFSIKTKLALAIGVPLLCAYMLMLVFEYDVGKAEALEVMEKRLTELASRQAAELNNNVASAQQVARTLAAVTAATPNLTPALIRKWLEDNVSNNPDVYGIAMAFEPYAFSSDVQWYSPYCCRDDATGLRYMDIADVYPDYGQRDWYLPAKTAKHPYWTEPYFDTGVGERMMCTYSVPFYRGGSLCGVMTVDVLTKDILDDLTQVDLGEGYCILISQKGTYISHPDPAAVMHESIFSAAKQLNDQTLADAGLQMIACKTGVCRLTDRRTNGPVWMVYAPVESAQWSLAAIIPENVVLAPIYARLERSMGILVGGCIIILCIVLLMSIRVTRPINRLTKAAESLAQGDLDVRIKRVRGSDEIARLGRTFNTMVADLKTSVDARIREEASRKRVEGELRSAREIQASLLPPMLPASPDRGFTLHALNDPARLVAGDFYDFFHVDQNRLALVIADVSGKGSPAAMFMAVVRTRLRDYAAPEKTPAEIIAALNASLAADNERGMFVTLFLGYYDVRSGELVYANAGHNPPYVMRCGSGFSTLEPTGPIVGVLAGAEYADEKCHIAQNDLLVLYTDGITEAHAASGPLFGEQRLEELLQSLADCPVENVCQSIIRAAGDFSKGDLSDDATVMVLKRTR